MRCRVFHKWLAWSKPFNAEVIGAGLFNRGVEGVITVQRRSCARCNKEQLRRIELPV